ncbi:MAG: hypothetical protein IJK41_07285 [Muribaculaceae bacterium]|nr:hypothetical protein [Muribaculaceae bacterium]
MKKTSSNVLKTVCVFALICIIVWLVFYAIQTYFVLTTGRGNGVLNWDSPHIGRKLTVFVINRITILTLAGLMAAFVHNILKHLKGGRIFNHANVVLLWIMAIVLPIHSFISDNMVFACSDIDHYDWCLTDTPFVYAIVAVLVAILYKLAYDAAEEQKLTI